jgi:competence protein ComEC
MLVSCDIDIESILNELVPPEGGDDLPPPTPVSGSLQVHFIDVGQADCILVETAGEYMLIDTGDLKKTCTEKIISYLDGIGIESLKYLILTHADSDHIGGAPKIIERYSVENCIMPDYIKTTKIFENTISALEDNQVNVIQAEPDYEFLIGEAECRVLAPLYEYEDCNDSSVVIRMTFGSNSFLLSGDAEKESEADMVEKYSTEDLKSDVYKSGHHGSKTSSCEEFLELIDPDYIVIMCGEGNSYGHPHAETTKRYEEFGIPYYRTDLHGTIIITSNGESLTITTEKTPK